MARVVRGRALEQRGQVSEAAEEIDRGVKLSDRGVAGLEIAYARLRQAETRRLQGDPDGAADALRHARAAIDRCPEPGIARDMLARSERRLRLMPSRSADDSRGRSGELTEPELRVLRLLPSPLSQREIGQVLYISFNTVKSHARSIYRKLDVESRDQAVERARGRGLL